MGTILNGTELAAIVLVLFLMMLHLAFLFTRHINGYGVPAPQLRLAAQTVRRAIRAIIMHVVSAAVFPLRDPSNITLQTSLKCSFSGIDATLDVSPLPLPLPLFCPHASLPLYFAFPFNPRKPATEELEAVIQQLLRQGQGSLCNGGSA